MATPSKPETTTETKPDTKGQGANLPAAQDQNKGGKEITTLPSGMRFRAVKRVVLPLLKLPANAECFVRVETPIYLGKEIKQTAGGGQKMAAAHLWNVIDFSDGSEKQMIVPSVLRSSIYEAYLVDASGKPVRADENGNYADKDEYSGSGYKHNYVGKSFAIRNHGKPEGKRYNVYEVIEIEQLPTAAQ